MLDSKIPAGPLDDKWIDYKGHCKLVNPANKRKLEIIIIGTGLAGASGIAGVVPPPAGRVQSSGNLAFRAGTGANRRRKAGPSQCVT